MSFVTALLLAAAAAQPGLTDAAEPQRAGAQVAEARITVEILRAVVMRDGEIAFSDGSDGPRAQHLQRGGRVTFEFE